MKRNQAYEEVTQAGSRRIVSVVHTCKFHETLGIRTAPELRKMARDGTIESFHVRKATKSLEM